LEPKKKNNPEPIIELLEDEDCVIEVEIEE